MGGAAFFAAWGEPSRPGLPPEGETEKGEIKFLAAAGHSSLVSNVHVALPTTPDLTMPIAR